MVNGWQSVTLLTVNVQQWLMLTEGLAMVDEPWMSSEHPPAWDHDAAVHIYVYLLCQNQHESNHAQVMTCFRLACQNVPGEGKSIKSVRHKLLHSWIEWRITFMLGDTLTWTCQGVSCIYPKNWPKSYYLLVNLVLIEGSLGTTVIDGNTPCKSSYLSGDMSVALVLALPNDSFKSVALKPQYLALKAPNLLLQTLTLELIW